MHGAWAGAPKGARNGNYKNGLYTNDAIAMRRAVRAALGEWRALALRCEAAD